MLTLVELGNLSTCATGPHRRSIHGGSYTWYRICRLPDSINGTLDCCAVYAAMEEGVGLQLQLVALRKLVHTVHVCGPQHGRVCRRMLALPDGVQTRWTLGAPD
jgi:hypothetical protein